jgi:light-regulated signal transduction histidine kinase (bacteriophytochrome)
MRHQPLVFKGKMCEMFIINDLSSRQKMEKINQENQIMKMLNQTVTHEMMTPVNCISRFAQYLAVNIKDSELAAKANLIHQTSMLL